jgi:hypothetical protein
MSIAVLMFMEFSAAPITYHGPRPSHLTGGGVRPQKTLANRHIPQFLKNGTYVAN